MPAATAMVEREEIIRRQQAGETYQQIANEMRLSYMNVCGICKHYERTGTVQPNYEACAKPGVRKDVAIYERAIQLKQAHPRWGQVSSGSNLPKSLPKSSCRVTEPCNVGFIGQVWQGVWSLRNGKCPRRNVGKLPMKCGQWMRRRKYASVMEHMPVGW